MLQDPRALAGKLQDVVPCCWRFSGALCAARSGLAAYTSVVRSWRATPAAPASPVLEDRKRDQRLAPLLVCLSNHQHGGHLSGTVQDLGDLIRAHPIAKGQAARLVTTAEAATAIGGTLDAAFVRIDVLPEIAHRLELE